MDNYIMFNGKKIPLTDEQIVQITKVEKSPFKRCDKNENYFYINAIGGVKRDVECNIYVDDYYFSVANYCADRDLTQQQAYREILNRLLWRFSYENGWSDDLWVDGLHKKYYFWFNIYEKEFYTNYTEYGFQPGIVYYISEETANRAIEEIVKPFLDTHPDFRDYRYGAVMK